MAKFNAGRTPTRSAITTERVPSGRTHENAPGYAHDTKSELFLLAVTNMVGENTFYENAQTRDDRYEQLVRAVAVADPAWTERFLSWLRTEANMRSASLVGALEATKAMVEAKIPGARQVVASVLQRADEPGEAVAYWLSRHGRAIPKPVKRGVADATRRLYSEYSLLKYDTASKGVRFGDVLNLTHASPSLGQSALFEYAVKRRHDGAFDPQALPMVLNSVLLRERVAGGDTGLLLDTGLLRSAGMTWEDALSLAGPSVDKRLLWEALIPTMGYMALLRNLRNFDEAGVSDSVASQVAGRLADPEQVARSRQLPFRFLAAYENAPSLRWGHTLDRALSLSLSNIPKLPGRSLVLVDTSGSMQNPFGKSTMTPAKAAAVFGTALALAGGQVDLHGFASGVFRHDVPAGASLIREVDRFDARIGEVGYGTDITGAVRATFRGQRRVFIISDMQTMSGGVDRAVPKSTPIYGFNLGGYRYGAFAVGGDNRHEFGGLTDQTFRQIPLLEAGRNGVWPWEV